MSGWRKKEVVNALCRKGFVKERSTKHEFFRLLYQGKVTAVRTYVSHGNRELQRRSGVFAAMANQLHLSPSQLVDFLDCPLSEEEYVAILRDGGIL